MNKKLLLELEKKLNIPHQNCMKKMEELEEAIKDTITKYKKTIFGEDSPTCMTCMNKLRKQQVIDGKVHNQRLMDDTLRKHAWDGL